MKYKEEMCMIDMMNFDREVVNFINDNLEFIKDSVEGDESPENLAAASLDYYNLVIDNEMQEDVNRNLSSEQRERFLWCAERLFRQGYVEHAGTMLSDTVKTIEFDDKIGRRKK